MQDITKPPAPKKKLTKAHFWGLVWGFPPAIIFKLLLGVGPAPLFFIWVGTFWVGTKFAEKVIKSGNKIKKSLFWISFVILYFIYAILMKS